MVQRIRGAEHQTLLAFYYPQAIKIVPDLFVSFDITCDFGVRTIQYQRNLIKNRYLDAVTMIANCVEQLSVSGNLCMSQRINYGSRMADFTSQGRKSIWDS